MSDPQVPTQTLGEFLRREREKKGYSLEQVASATKIGLRILAALEADRYTELPAIPFVRGFIKNYSKFLGNDPEKILNLYQGFLETQSAQRPQKDKGHMGYAFERPEGEQSRKVLWAIMGGMFIFGGLVILIFKPSLKHRKHGHVEKLQVVTSPVASPVASPAVSFSPLAVPLAPLVLVAPTPSPSAVVVKTVVPSPLPLPVPSPKVTAAAAPVVSVVDPAQQVQDPLQSGTEYTVKEIKYKVLFKALADVWVRYQCDEKSPMKFILRKDKILVLRGKSTVKFQASNPDSIHFNANGGGYKLMSGHSNVFEYVSNATLVFPAELRGKINEIFLVTGKLPVTKSPEITQ